MRTADETLKYLRESSQPYAGMQGLGGTAWETEAGVWKPENKSQKLLSLALSKGGNRMPENPPKTLLGLLDFEVH